MHKSRRVALQQQHELAISGVDSLVLILGYVAANRSM
jgi:hypothetical protein